MGLFTQIVVWLNAAANALGKSLAFIGFMFCIARPIAAKYFRKFGEQEITPNLVAVVLALLSLVTQRSRRPDVRARTQRA